MRAEGRQALLVATAGAAAAVALASPSLPMPVRALAAGALAFALPGLAVLAALMPQVRWRRSERVAVGLGGSLTIAIGTAFVLHASPGGLTAGGWAGLLGAVTVGGGLLGWLRSLRGPVADPAIDDPATGGAWATGTPAAGLRLTLVSPSALAMLGVAGLLVALSLVIARSGVALGPTASFSELWLLRTDGDGAVRVGVANHEGAERAYRLIITVDGRRLGDPVELTLADGETADDVVPLPLTGAVARTVEARLWYADRSPSDLPLRLVRAVIRGAETDP